MVHIVNKLLIVHSPMLGAVRAASLNLIHTRVAPACLTGTAEMVTSDEPNELVPRIPTIVDVDASHIDDPSFKPLVKNMHVRQVSNTMKHVAALRRASNVDGDNNMRFSLILEDDALFGENVITALGYAVKDAPHDADIVFLGLPSTKQPPSEGAVFDDVLALFGVLPACESYLVTPSAAARISAAMLPVRFQTNVQLTYAIKTLGIKAYLAVPNVFVDGSKLGVFTCSVDPNNRLMWNQPYCQMETIVRNMAAYNVSGGAECDAEFQKAWTDQPFKEHPDVLSIKATHLVRMGRLAEAHTVFAAALEIYDRNGSIVSNTSEFLRNYIAIFRDLQPATSA